MNENDKSPNPSGDAQWTRETAGNPAPGASAPGFETSAPRWIDAGEQFSAYSLPGRIQLSPSVWLCCVYLAPRVAERVDANRESVRLDALLCAAADAWKQHRRTPDNDSCVFAFQPDAPVPMRNAVHNSAPGYLIRVACEVDENNATFTRLEFAG